MKKYKLNKAKFLDFILGTVSMVALASLLVWILIKWIELA